MYMHWSPAATTQVSETIFLCFLLLFLEIAVHRRHSNSKENLVVVVVNIVVEG